MKKLLVALLMVALCAAAWAGGGEEQPEGPITLRIMGSESAFTTPWIESWNAQNPNVQVTREEENHAKWIADYLAGSPADLLYFPLGFELSYFVNRGMLLDLTEYFENSDVIDMDDIDVNGSGSYQYDGVNSATGSWYGLPKDFNNVTAITYNREIFDAAGLPYPSATEPMTYDEFEALAAQLVQKGPDGNTVVFGTEVHGIWYKLIASDMAYMRGLSLLDEDGYMNDEPAVRDIWKYLLRLRKSGISSSPADPLSGWAGSAFQSGNVGMVQLGYWYGASSAEVEGYEEKFGWAPAPVMDKGGMRVTNTLGASGFVISALTEYPDQTFEVFEWYMAGEPGIERAVTGWGIPPLKSLQPMLPEESEYDRVRKEIALEESKYFRPPQLSTYVRTTAYDGPWEEAKNAYLEGNVTADEALDMFFEAMNANIDLGRQELGL